MPKHLILIHGRATKPREREKKRLVLESLAGGLRRVDEGAAKALESGRVKFTFVYYGDVCNRLMVEAEPERRKEMEKDGENWFEPGGSYDEDLERLVARPTNRHGAEDYRKLLKEEKDKSAYDNIARAVSPVLSLFGLSERVIKKTLPDLGAYLTSRVVGSEIRERLQAPLRKALLAGDEVALVAHSMGCIVSYDVLWKFSRMSEYRDTWGHKVSLWLTLGNPLGEPAVRENLYDADEPEDGMYPSNAVHWLNIAAKDDFVAHDATAADDFSEMRQRRLVQKIEDMPRIYTFWAGYEGSNPHKFYGYLNHPKVAARLARWIK
jgi:hypothetical protein